MGQQCCTDDHLDSKLYQNGFKTLAKPDPNTTRRISTGSSSTMHFSAVDKLPKMNPVVENIHQRLGPFRPSNNFVAPEGSIQTRAYALNHESLIYGPNSEWRDGVPHGKGQLYYQDGSYYTGYFSKGIPNGQGRFISPQGWFYQGEIEKEQAEGLGHFMHEGVGYKYEGSWAGDLPDGKGKEIWTKSGRSVTYEGQYTSGKKHGVGRYKFGEEWIYEGTFNQNQITGSNGSIKYKSGESYSGDFKNGKKHGYGIYKWPDHSVYEGWYKDDKKDGHGKFVQQDGKIFEGEWKEGKRDGKGVLIIQDKKYPGQWQNDQPISSRHI